MIGGRLNGTTVASRICCASPNMRRIKACAELAAPALSSNGLSLATRNAAFNSLAVSSSENPITANVSWICGSVLSSSSIFRATSLVRATEAPSGNCTFRKKAP